MRIYRVVYAVLYSVLVYIRKFLPMRVGGGGLFIANFLFWNCSSPKLTFLLDITQGSLPPTPLWRQGPASNLNFVFYLIICYLIQSSTSGKCNTADIHRFKRCLEYFTLKKFPSPFWGNHIFWPLIKFYFSPFPYAKYRPLAHGTF